MRELQNSTHSIVGPPTTITDSRDSSFELPWTIAMCGSFHDATYSRMSDEAESFLTCTHSNNGLDTILCLDHQTAFNNIYDACCSGSVKPRLIRGLVDCWRDIQIQTFFQAAQRMMKVRPGEGWLEVWSLNIQDRTGVEGPCWKASGAARGIGYPWRCSRSCTNLLRKAQGKLIAGRTSPMQQKSGVDIRWAWRLTYARFLELILQLVLS